MAKPKLRKMLGSADAPNTLELMRLIDTQSRETICSWCMDYAEMRMLPIYERHCPDDMRPRRALEAARAYLRGERRFLEVKQIILNECHAAARELDENPAAQAAARACGQGAAVVHTLSHSLGIYFYGAAAIAYDRLGIAEKPETYAKVADEVCAELIASLKAVAVKDEPNPAAIKWYC